MPGDGTPGKPRLYFLNERHQLAPGEKSGGGRATEVRGLDWQSHGVSLNQNLTDLRAVRHRSGDPSGTRRAYVLARAPESISRTSSAKDAENGEKSEPVDLAKGDSRIIERLGFDLLAVCKDGTVIVHATDERMEQIANSLHHLADLPQRAKNAWARLNRFEEIPVEFKASIDWWPDSSENGPVEAIIDLQAYLTRDEVDDVIKAIAGHLEPGEKLRKIGREFSGRTWILANMTSKSIIRMVQSFQSVFSIHPPLFAISSAPRMPGLSARHAGPSPTHYRQTLPVVAVVDTGIPDDHCLLADFIRGRVTGDGAGDGVADSHGCYVASRVVFGDVECRRGDPADELIPACQVHDVNVGYGIRRIHAPAVWDAMRTVSNSAPDVRVFNLSIDAATDVDSLDGGFRDAWLRHIADLDNLIFSDDILVIVAAGNSDPGVIPRPSYPRNFGDPQWRLRAWSRCFNALTCGGTADRLSPDGVASELGAPSPFCRTGPGFANSPKPDFAAHAGNCGPSYRYARGSGMGVWGCNEEGLWEDDAATSFAAPILARDAARCLSLLQEHCEAGTRPFACLVKACLAMHAQRPAFTNKSLEKLASHTLGFGRVDFGRIEQQLDDRAVFLWQGILNEEGELLALELPLPGEWIDRAERPELRLIAAWDTPVNPGVPSVWACRKVEVTLRRENGADAMKQRTKARGRAYPLFQRVYHLDAAHSERDACLLELSYTTQDMAPLPAGALDFSPQQRIGLAYSLVDRGQSPVSPHAYVQALPVAATLNTISSALPRSRQAVRLRVPN